MYASPQEWSTVSVSMREREGGEGGGGGEKGGGGGEGERERGGELGWALKVALTYSQFLIVHQLRAPPL